MAGAEVIAITRTTKYGAAEEIAEQTRQLAAMAGVAPRIQVVTHKHAEIVQRADIVTNSGHVRPIDAVMIGQMKETAVIPLMYEAWEFRSCDVDLDGCRARGIAVAGTNERNPAIDVFSYLGNMAVKLLMDAGVALHGSEVLVLCDNAFAPFIEKGLRGSGASVEVARRLQAPSTPEPKDAVLVALTPKSDSALGAADAALIREYFPGAVLAQYWGDVDRTALIAAGVPCWPGAAPDPGHMGILPSALGPEPIVRLQSGGLRVGEILWRSRMRGDSSEESVTQAERSGFGMRVD
jgi:hypothetical protein